MQKCVLSLLDAFAVAATTDVCHSILLEVAGAIRH
jgi:hypothetical protein